MNIFENIYLLIFLSCCISAFLTVLFLPLSKKIGVKYKILDDPDPRKMHKNPTVRIGGLSIVISYFLTILIIWQASLFRPLGINVHNTYILLIILSIILKSINGQSAVSLIIFLILYFCEIS